MIRRPPRSTLSYTLFPYMTLFRSCYMVESNCGHIGDDIDPKGGNDPTLYGYRAAVESARLSRHLAAQIYGEPPANGYVYGGSGGGRRSPGCMEYGKGVYTGALPYHSGGNVEPYGTKSRVRSEQPVHLERTK